jgi:hypothetical protein
VPEPEPFAELGLVEVEAVQEAAALGRDTDNYPLGGVTERRLARARELLAKARIKPDKLVLYTHTPGFLGVNALWAQVFQFT